MTPLSRWHRALRSTPITLGIALSPVVAGAQSAYVPLDDVAYVYVDALIARGELRTLSLLDRPYTVRALREAMVADSRRISARARATSPSPTTRPSDRMGIGDLNARLGRAIAKYDFAGRSRATFRAEVSAGLGATGETSGQRELMLGDDQDPAVFAGGALRFLLAAGPVVAFSRSILDNRLNTDPDFHGRTDRRIAGRNEDGYLAGQWRYGELFFGRMARNWGPAPLQGLLLSNAPYTYDHLFGRIGTPRVNVSVLLARLENDSIGLGNEVQRYLATHRFRARWRGVEVALAESYVYTGVGRGFEPALANPFAIYGLTWRNERQEGNLLATAQLATRTRLGVFSGELLIDDIQIDRCDTICAEPSSYGLTFAAEGLRLPFGQRAFASYTRVSSLAYRTPTAAERYTMFEVGLGRAFSDYDEVRIGADVVVAGAPLRAYFAHRRQGEGDYRRRFPEPEDYEAHPGIFEGAMTRVGRLGVSGGAVIGSFDLRGDVGYNWVDNSGPLTQPITTGAFFRPTTSSFEGRIRLSWNPRWARIRFAP